MYYIILIIHIIVKINLMYLFAVHEAVEEKLKFPGRC